MNLIESIGWVGVGIIKIVLFTLGLFFQAFRWFFEEIIFKSVKSMLRIVVTLGLLMLVIFFIFYLIS